MEIRYEKMSKKDYADVKRLITEAWFSDYPFPKEIIDLYSKGYLYMYLSELDYCVVAKDGDKTVGFIFGRNNKVSHLQKMLYKSKLFFVGLSLLFSKAGRRGLKINHITNVANKKLYKMSKIDTTSELVLFIVDDKYRGLGIGSKLEKDFCDFLFKEGKDSVYLYTDTYSNYKYYENRGYERMAETEVDFKIEEERGEQLPKYYLYLKRFKEDEKVQ